MKICFFSFTIYVNKMFVGLLIVVNRIGVNLELIFGKVNKIDQFNPGGEKKDEGAAQDYTFINYTSHN